MGLDLRVAYYCRLRVEVSKTVKEPLGPWVDDQEPIGWSEPQNRWEVRVCKKPNQSLFSGTLSAFLHPLLPVSSAYLARLSPPTTSTFTLAHRLATAAFSSVVKCTMVSGSLLVILMGQKQVCAASSLCGLLFLISYPKALPSPNKRRLFVKGRWPPPGVGLGQGWVSKMDICVPDSVSGSIRDTLLLSPLPSTVQFISQGPHQPSWSDQ